MVSTRLVPRASGLLGHVAAEAGTDTTATVQTNNATRKRIERLAFIYPAPTNVILSRRLAPLAHSPTRSKSQNLIRARSYEQNCSRRIRFDLHSDPIARMYVCYWG